MAQSLENGKSKCVACINSDSKYCIQRTLLRNRLVITNKKVTKNQTKTLYASKEENEEMSKRETKISTRMYLRHVITKIQRLRDIDLGLFSSSISSFTSYLFSLEIVNKKHNRYPEDALYARHGSRSCKNIAQARER